MKYIDAEKLIAEIDSILSSCTKQTHTGVFNTCTHFKGLITSLQQEQPEADLEKEMEDYLGEDWKDGTLIEVQNDMIQFARHFYELGKNARKEK